MASSDVIELGSSDDEAEPVPKKKKPTLNAMVRFPNEVPGLVIKPVKPLLPNLQKVLAGGAVTITNVKKGKVIPQVNKVMPNGRSVQKFSQKPSVKMPRIRNITITNPIPVSNLQVNPISFMKKQNIRVQGPKLSLPPGITIKRTAASQNKFSNVLPNRRNQNFKRKQPGKIITTVELDDEEVPLSSGTNPQWYIRPEEQLCHTVDKEEKMEKDKENNDNNMEVNVNMELENNKEPDSKKYIEITIEDSPIKPLQVLKGFEVGSELPITIEDSPIKPFKSPKNQPCGSDNETEKSNITEPQSKKRLDYPKNEEEPTKNVKENIVEINSDIPIVDACKENLVENTDVKVVDETRKNMDVEIEESPKRAHTIMLTKEGKDEEKSNKQNTEQNSGGEFHPTYLKFINLCFELENSDDMSKIVEKKIKTYYRQCPKEYVESEEFIDMVSSKIFAMKAAPDKMYLYIKDIVDELNLQRKTAKATEVSYKENKKAGDDNYFIAEDAGFDTKRRRQIRKLEKTIKKLHRAIQKLEEQEVEFEDEEDSVYLLTERYKERLIRVHAKFCQLTNTKMPSEPRIQIEARPALPAGPAKRLEKWVNKKVPIGTPLPFPDFHDVLRCVREANDEDNLGWNEADIMAEARDLFTRCGKKLQRRRQENEWRIAAARIAHDVSTLDPAEKSDDLKKKLEENKTLAAKKEIELLNKYADKQNQLKLVGEEIGDKEAEESPVESEEDEGHDESNSLENKQKRKERLKRLLHEKTLKMSSEKENNTNEPRDNKEENEDVKSEEKMECNILSEKTENKEDVQEVITESEAIINDITKDISEDAPTKDQQQQKTNESDLYDVDSDIDELHLLQKLYSENEMNSSQDSDSDTPIAISDTLDSDSDHEDVKVQQTDDIISIENSSYSESEVTKDGCENVKVFSVIQDKKIDGLLLQNNEILLPSSLLTGKIDIDEENILLASSEEDNDVDSSSRVDQTEISTCSVKMSNDISVNNDCEVSLSNGDENSLENDLGPYEVPISGKEIDETDMSLTPVSLESNHHDYCNDVISQNNIQLENYMEVNTRVSIERNQENPEVITSNDANKVSSDETKCIVNEPSIENETDINFEIDNQQNQNNSIISKSSNNKITAVSKEVNSKHHKEYIQESCQEVYVVDDNVESSSNSGNAIYVEKDFNESEVMDVNIEVTGNELLLLNQKTTCDGVEVPSSVQ